MDVILDELRKNNVGIDMTTLSYHIHQCLEQYKTMFEKMIILPLDLPEIFEEMDVNSFGRAMAYLTLVYLMNIPEDAKREAVRLVATVLRDVNVTRVEKSFFQRMLSGIRRVFAI